MRQHASITARGPAVSALGPIGRLGRFTATHTRWVFAAWVGTMPNSVTTPLSVSTLISLAGTPEADSSRIFTAAVVPMSLNVERAPSPVRAGSARLRVAVRV